MKLGIEHTKIYVKKNKEFVAEDGVVVASKDSKGGELEINTENTNFYLDASVVKSVMKKAGLI